MNEQDTLKQHVVNGFLWKAFENGGDQIITFVISLVIARLLGPEKYGTMTIMLMFVAIGNVLIQTGFQTALIQRRDVTEDDFSSVIWLGLLLSAGLYLLIFCAAPCAAAFFGDPEITPMLRVLSLILFFGAVISVACAIVARSMRFAVQCRATVLADLLSGAVGIFAAYREAGTWALVWQQLTKHLFLMLLLLLELRFRPRLVFCRERIGQLFSYGWKVLVSGLIDTVYNNLYTPVISKLYSPVMVGYYGKGNQFPQIAANAMAQTMQAVMLPAFSGVQDETERLGAMLRRTVKTGSFVMFPMMFGMAAVAKPLVELLLGEAWLPSAPLLQLCCLSYCVWPMHVANLQAVNAKGRSDIYLKLEIIKKIMGVAVLVLSASYGIAAMLFVKAAFDFVCTLINAAPNARLAGYGPFRQWRDVLPELLLSLAMGAVVLWGVPQVLQLLGIGEGGMSAVIAIGAADGGLLSEAVSTSGGQTLRCLITLCAQVAAGVVFYLGGAAIFRMESLRYLAATAKGLIRRKH